MNLKTQEPWQLNGENSKEKLEKQAATEWRAFSDRSFLKILIFSTIYGRFRAGQVNL